MYVAVCFFDVGASLCLQTITFLEKEKKKENATGFVCPSLNHQVASFAARLDSILKRTIERKLLHKCA